MPLLRIHFRGISHMGKNPKSVITVLFSVFTLRSAPFFSSSVITASPSYPYPRNGMLWICLAMYFWLSRFLLESRLLTPKAICNFTFTGMYHSRLWIQISRNCRINILKNLCCYCSLNLSLFLKCPLETLTLFCRKNIWQQKTPDRFALII